MTTDPKARTGGSLAADLRMAWLLTRGSDRREWWRVGLTALGAALATGFALAAVCLASLRGQYAVPVGAGDEVVITAGLVRLAGKIRRREIRERC